MSLVGGAGTAWASWAAAGTGAGSSKAVALPTGATPTVSVSGRNVVVSWAQVSLPNATPGHRLPGRPIQHRRTRRRRSGRPAWHGQRAHLHRGRGTGRHVEVHGQYATAGAVAGHTQRLQQHRDRGSHPHSPSHRPTTFTTLRRDLERDRSPPSSPVRPSPSGWTIRRAARSSAAPSHLEPDPIQWRFHVLGDDPRPDDRGRAHRVRVGISRHRSPSAVSP